MEITTMVHVDAKTGVVQWSHRRRGVVIHLTEEQDASIDYNPKRSEDEIWNDIIKAKDGGENKEV